MKKIIYISIILILMVPLFLTSCLKEDNTKAPIVTDTKMFMTDKQGKDSLVTDVYHGQKIKIVVYTNADLIAIWPSAIRTIMKMKNSTADSIDMFNHPVLVVSDYYSDYGLVKAKGLSTTQLAGGWYAFYTYPAAGAYDLTIVATNHGYDGANLNRIIKSEGKITIK